MMTRVFSKYISVMTVSAFITFGALSSLHASKVAILVRAEGAGAERAAQYVDDALQGALPSVPERSAVNFVNMLGSPDLDRATRAFETAEALAENGKQAYEMLDLEQSVEHLTASIRKYARHVGYLRDVRKIADALLLQAAVHLLEGDERTGAKRIRQALTLIPDIEPEAAIFNASMRDVFTATKRRLKAAGKGALTVNSTPGYGQVYLDSKFIGTTPMTIGDLPPGQHYLRVVKAGYRNWGKVIRVAVGSEASASARLKPTSDFDDFEGLMRDAFEELEEGGEEVDFASSMEQLAQLLGADELLFVNTAVDGDTLVLRSHLFDATQEKQLSFAERTFLYGTDILVYREELAQMVEYNIWGYLLHPPGSDSDAVGDDDDREDEDGVGDSSSWLSGLGDIMTMGSCFGMACDQFKLTVLIGGAGGGTLLSGIGLFLQSSARSKQNEFLALDQVDSKRTSLRASGQSRAFWGDTLLYTGLVTATVGTALYFLWHPQASAADVVEESEGWSFNVVPFVPPFATPSPQGIAGGGGFVSAQLTF